MGIMKMTKNESKKFEMQMDDEGQPFQIQEEAEDLKLKKLSSRITRISIVLPCLLGIIIVAAYFDLRKNLTSVNIKGDMGVETLSKELESRFSALSIKEANLEDTLNKKIATLEASTKEAELAIKNIRTARNADNKKTEDALKNIEATLDPIPKELKKISSDLKQFDQVFTEKLSTFSQFVSSSKNDLLEIRSDISSLKSTKVDQAALKDQQKVYQLALRQSTTHLDDRIKSIENMLKELEKVKAPSNRQSQTQSEKSLTSSQVETKSAPGSVSPMEINTPKPGMIIEQDLEKKTQE